MSELQNFLLVVDRNRDEALQFAGITAQKLCDKETSLIDVVQSLGEYINDEDAVIRGKAVSYLTAVIKALPDKFLSRQQTQVLTTFYCDRAEDGGAIAGLDKLQSLDRFNKEMAQNTLRALILHFPELRLRTQSQRHQILQLLNGLMSNHREALRDLQDESLVGIVDLVNGERDPRNLMLVFSILRVLMVEWDISNHVQDLFDSVYNYFPITFKPPPNDPYGITAQDLKSRLQDCISSTPLFAPHAFPSLLDKLDSTSLNVKKDALSALAACVSEYYPATVSRYSVMIWDSLKFEILNAQEEILADESLRVLQALGKRLSDPPPANLQQSPLAHYLKPINKECNEQLREPQQKQAKPAQRILRSLSAASPASFILVIQAVVAPLLTVYQDADGIAKQRALLEALVALFDAAVEVFGTWTNRHQGINVENPLAAFQDRLIEIFSQSLMGSAKDEISYRIVALQGLLRLSSLRDFLQDSEIGLLVQYLNDILLTEPISRPELRKEAVLALAEISKYKSRLIRDITFPAFMATLPDTGAEGDQTYISTLDSLAQISTEQDIFETLVRRLLSKLDIVLQPENASSPAYPCAILLTILYAMDRKGLQNDPQLDFYFDRIVVRLCRQATVASLKDDSPAVLKDSSFLDTLGRLCNLIVRTLPRSKQDEVCHNIYELFSVSDGFNPVPFAERSTGPQRQTMILSTYLLAGVPKDSQLPSTSQGIGALLHEIVHRANSEENLSVQLALVRHLALLVNKFLPTSELSIPSSILFSLIPIPTNDQKLSPLAIRTIFWLSKALILRLAPTTTEILSSLLSLLASLDETTSNASARGFGLLLSEDDVVSPINGANIRLLCKQRVFTTVVPLISARVRDLNAAAGGSKIISTSLPSHAKQAYLTALSGLLSTIPSSLVMPELPTLFPLLLQSLDLTDSDSQPIKSGTLETLAIIIRDNGVSVIHEKGYVEDLVNRLLKTSTHTTSGSGQSTPQQTPPVKNSPRVRAQALQCLLLLAQNPGLDSSGAADKSKPSPLLPLKSAVLRTLRMSLDDPKRDVRKAAVDARAAWLRSVEDQEEDEED